MRLPRLNIIICRGVAAAVMAACAVASASGATPLDKARWIGADGAHMPFHAPDLSVFRIEFDVRVEPGASVALLYGVDDPRLMDSGLNIYGLSAQPGESAVKLGMGADGSLTLFRSGYHPDDDGSRPLAEFDASSVWRTGELNHVELSSNLGHTEVTVNGHTVGRAKVGSVGNGGDYLAFPVLAGMAVDITRGSGEIGGVTVSNFRSPSRPLFRSEGVFTASGKIDVPWRSMPQLRTSFGIHPDKKVSSVSITATARGIYDMEVNGHRVTDGYFYPGSTQYNLTHLYHTFDITPFVTSLDNTLTVQLGEGWWSGPATFVGENWNFFGDRQSFLAAVTVEYADGSRDDYVTEPERWECSVDGPVKSGSFFNGEVYDATVEDGYATREWFPAVEIAADTTVNRAVGMWADNPLRPSFGDNVAAVDTLVAVGMTEPRAGVYVYDLGQNMAGVPLIDFSGLERGITATMRYAEMLYPDMPRYAANRGMVMTENLRAAMCRDAYTARGEGRELFSPRFTLHGYRFIEITGLSAPLPLEAVKSVALSSVKRFRAGFECSDTLVNRLWENIGWSTRSNFISIPTDCPQRNERLGWMGDISVFAPTATRLADVSSLLAQYLQSVRDCQREDGRFPDVAPTGFGFGGLLWGSAGITVPREHFRQYADTALLRDHYPAMRRYIDYIFNEAVERHTGLIVQERAWSDLGDWLSPEYERADKSLLWECYFIHDLDIMAWAAGILGYEDDARRYAADASARRDFFNKVYVDPVSRKTRYSAFVPEKAGQAIDTQVSYALPIAMGITDDPLFRANFVNTVERSTTADDGGLCPPYSLMTGFIGTAWISEALTLVGRSDLAYRMLTNRSYPSWLYPVTQGATTVWERLNSYTHVDGFGSNNSMNSFNHYSFGAVGNWLITRVLGISEDDGGRLVVAPEPDRSGSLTWAKGWLETRHGRVETSWRRIADTFVIDVDLPADAVFRDSSAGRDISLGAGRHRMIVR